MATYAEKLSEAVTALFGLFELTFADRMPFVAILGQLLQRGANADGERQGKYVGFWQVVILFLKNFIWQVPAIALFHVWVKSGGHVAQVANLVRDGLGRTWTC